MGLGVSRALAYLMVFVLASSLSPANAQAGATITEEAAYEIGVEAYVYLYPLITMDVTRRVMSNLPSGQKPGVGPMNEFQHFRAFPTVDFRDVVRPNFDTLYSVAWLDLTREPAVVSVPDTEGRYYLLPMLDMWTDVFAVPGKRTSGTGAGQYAVVPPGWAGRLPAGIERIDSPTRYVWIIGRTQTNGTNDYDAVNKVQDGYKITALSKWGKKAEPVKFVADPTVEMKIPPMEQVNGMTAAEYFAYGAELMKLHPPHVTDWSQVERMKRIGLEAGKSFDWAKTSPEIRAALEQAMKNGLQVVKDKAANLTTTVAGWQINRDTMGVWGNFYLKRAGICLYGLGANHPEDAIYPVLAADGDGKPLDGANKYVIHFTKDGLPPVNAFWSITMYDADGFMVPNKINRYAIGDRDALKYNADGSLDIYMQSESPGADKESNWLPSPAKGNFGPTMRMYAPKASVIDGTWAPPAVKRVGVDASSASGKAGSGKLNPGPIEGLSVQLDKARNYAFCEFNVGFGATPNMVFQIYNSTGNKGPDGGFSYPTDKLAAIDPKKLASELGASFVLLNPNPPTATKRWVMDELLLYVAGETADFAGVKATWMALIGENDLKSGSNVPYTPGTNRQLSKWIFKKGNPVFLIRTPDAKVYVMQAFTTEVDKNLTYEQLSQLGGRMKNLPPGWEYEVKILEKDLVFDTTKATPEGLKHLIKDEFKNVYLGLGFDKASNFVP